MGLVLLPLFERADVSFQGIWIVMTITTVYRYACGYQAPLTMVPLNLHYARKCKYHLSPLHKGTYGLASRFLGTKQSFRLFFFFLVFCLLRAAPKHMEVPRSGDESAIAAGHSHGNWGSKLHLQPTPMLRKCQILNPLSMARDQTHVLMDTSPIR